MLRRGRTPRDYLNPRQHAPTSRQAGDIIVLSSSTRAGASTAARTSVIIIIGLDIIDRHAWTRVGYPTAR